MLAQKIKILENTNNESVNPLERFGVVSSILLFGGFLSAVTFEPRFFLSFAVAIPAFSL